MNSMSVTYVMWHTLFPEILAITHTHTVTHTSKFRCAIHCTCGIIMFPLFVLLIYISCKKKFFMEGVFIEYYTQEMQNAINCKIL